MEDTLDIYKLTDRNMQTYGGFQWVLNKTVGPLSGIGNLCGPGFIHAYTDPLLAVLLDPIHAAFGESSRLFAAEGEVAKTDRGLKVGVISLTITREIPKPVITMTQTVAFGVLCARRFPSSRAWNEWADRWLTGIDRTEAVAEAEEAATTTIWDTAREAALLANGAEAASAAALFAAEPALLTVAVDARAPVAARVAAATTYDTAREAALLANGAEVAAETALLAVEAALLAVTVDTRVRAAKAAARAVAVTARVYDIDLPALARQAMTY